MRYTKGPWEEKTDTNNPEKWVTVLVNSEGEEAYRIEYNPKTTMIACLQGDQLLMKASPLLLEACVEALKKNLRNSSYDSQLNQLLTRAIEAAGTSTIYPDSL